MSEAVVTERALVARINRRLAHGSKTLRRARRYAGGYDNANLGRYYVLNTDSNTLAGSHIHLENYSRELGVMRPGERLPA